MRLGTIALFMLTSCGVSEKEQSDAAKKELDTNAITLDPSAGTYTYRPWVILTKSDDGLGSGILYAKGPGAAEFKSTTLGCLDSPYDSNSAPLKQGRCVEVVQSGTLAYYLETTGAKGDEQHAEYVIQIPTHNVAIAARDKFDGEATNFELQEAETACGYSYSNENKLNVAIKTKADSRISADRVAYVVFEIPTPSAGLTVKFGKENDAEAGIIIKPASDDPPKYFYDVDYTTKPYIAYSSDDTRPDPTCEIVVSAVERGKIASGTFTCTQLRTDDNADTALALLGNFVTISGSWQCDRWYR